MKHKFLGVNYNLFYLYISLELMFYFHSSSILVILIFSMAAVNYASDLFSVRRDLLSISLTGMALEESSRIGFSHSLPRSYCRMQVGECHLVFVVKRRNYSFF